MMEHGDDMRIPPAVERFQLLPDPGELHVVSGDIRVEHDEEVAAVAEPERRVTVQAARRTFRRPQFGHCRRRIAQTGVSFRTVDPGIADVVVADREEVRNPAVVNQTFNERREADIPLTAAAPGDDGVAGLNNESHGKPGAFLVGNRREHSIDHVAVGRLKPEAIGGTAGVPVGDEGEFGFVGAGGFRR
jgi:hypothetical protein